ncbi:M20/M25/M40 family metallo-hydrolase [Chondromyces apiculatus]|uniref:ArgE/DapE/Acy1 family protein n=1 Tax=Chondromyces apiculatus DSM 436 TaxID=1192034 RepID=A0A017T8K2_9BACT|nr:M20/M25/M40 family metallo-hydrolase [Chondromyces apiculatus]EYF04941.1 ArgE/DapE/Acy1 family protein [Chondromyces apiculatus DSM 436]
MARWVALHPTAGSPPALTLAAEITSDLSALGFDVEQRSLPGHSPLIVARRPAGPGGATLGIYGHYDVEPVHGQWSSDATHLRLEGGRAYGRGIADNLGPLASRLLAARDVRAWPGVLWVLEGEEETGSPLLAAYLEELRDVDVDLWLDETGYHEAPDRQRILTVRWPAALDDLRALWRTAAAEHAVAVVAEQRALNRASGGIEGPVTRLFAGRPYVSLGPNDDASNVHGADESLPRHTLPLCAEQFVATLQYLASWRSP